MLRGKKRPRSGRGKIGGGRGKIRGRGTASLLSDANWGVSGARSATKKKTVEKNLGAKGPKKRLRCGLGWNLGMKRLEPPKRSKLWCVWGANPRKKWQCSSRIENAARSATKKTAAARLGIKGAQIAANPGKIFQLCRRKKMLCSRSRNRYLIPDRECLNLVAI